MRVEDEGGRAVADSMVTFTAPPSGASGEFGNASRTITLTTGPNGQATVTGYHPNGITGAYQIQVRADYRGQTATAVILQRNIAQPGGHGKLITVLAVVGTSAGVAIAVRGTRHTTQNIPAPTITIGGSAVGAPR